MSKQDETLEKNLAENGVPEKAWPAFKAMMKDAQSLTQGDKLFLRNQLDMRVEDAMNDFMLAIALWKRRGGGMIEWRFVLEMTDEAISSELGIPTDEELEDAKGVK